VADAGYCSSAGIEYAQQRGADVLVRVNPQSFVAYSQQGRRISLLPRLRTLARAGQYGEWWVVLHGQDSSFAGRLCAVRSIDRRRAHPVAHYQPRSAPTVSRLGIPLDAADLRRCSFRNFRKPVADTARSFIHRNCCDSVWNTLFLPLAQTHSNS
jgi:hypothetical protein